MFKFGFYECFRYIIEKLGITAFSMQEVDKYGINEVMSKALKVLDPEYVLKVLKYMYYFKAEKLKQS